VARAHLRDDARAADVAQGALVSLFSRASEFEPGRAVVPWFYAILANELRSATRRGGGWRGALGSEGDGALEAIAADGDPEQEFARSELRAAVDAAIATLDMPSAEAIGVLLGDRRRPSIAPPAFRKRVSRAYARLRVLLKGYR
jgi:RNA polymerase sigma-70 factor (ECF subfamily)